MLKSITFAIITVSLCLTILSFAVFTSTIFFPPLIIYLHLDKIPYYALAYRYIRDPELIMRHRPFYKFETDTYPGDVYSPFYGIKAHPLSYRAYYDKDGFRNSWPGKSCDIVILGDSYMEFGLDDSDLFGGRLSRITGLKTANFAVAGYGPNQYLIAYKRYGIQKGPRYAFLCFYEGNDLMEVAAYTTWEKGGRYGNSFSRTIFQDYLSSVKSTVNFLKSGMKDAVKSVLCRFSGPFRKHQMRELAELDIGGKSIWVRFFWMPEWRQPEKILMSDEGVALRKILTDFKNTSIENGIVPVVIYIPDKVHIYAGYSTKESGSCWLGKRSAVIASSQNLEIATEILCKEIDIRLIDLTSLFKSLAKDGRFLYYPFDTHWNSEAREAAALYVAG